MVIVDTSVWIDYFGGIANAHTDWLDGRLGVEPVGLTDLILCEILQGIKSDSQFRKVRRSLSALDVFPMGGEEMAVRAAENFRRLRVRGYTVRTTIDCLIGTFCVTEGHGLLHKDRDFDAFERFLGLRVIHP